MRDLLFKLFEFVLRALGLWNQNKSSITQLHAAHRVQLPPELVDPPFEPEEQRVPVIEVVREPAPPLEVAEPITQRLLPAIEIDEKGIMHGVGVSFVPSKRTNALATKDKNVDGIEWHWTDTRGVGALALAKRIVEPPRPDQHVGSCHIWTDAEGLIVQSVPLTLGAWHAGYGFTFAPNAAKGGAWEIHSPGRSPNYWAAGIEQENVGEVRLITHKDRKVWVGWPFAFGTKYGAPCVVPVDEVKVHPLRADRGWHIFPQAQIDAAERITHALARRCALTREMCTWGHTQTDPQNRTDPGPLWLGSVNGNGWQTPKVGCLPDGHLFKILDRVFATTAPQ